MTKDYNKYIEENKNFNKNKLNMFQNEHACVKDKLNMLENEYDNIKETWHQLNKNDLNNQEHNINTKIEIVHI